LIILFLSFLSHVEAIAETEIINESKDTPYLEECKDPRSRSDEFRAPDPLAFISDLLFPDSRRWKSFLDFPKIDDEKIYKIIYNNLIEYHIRIDSYFKDSVNEPRLFKELFEFVRYIPMRSENQVVYSGYFLLVDGNLRAIVPEKPHLELIDVTNSRILRVNPKTGRDTEYVAVDWYYIAGGNIEYFERGFITPTTVTERVESIGLMCIPKSSKEIRIEIDLTPEFQSTVRFSPNIDTFGYFYYSPKVGNELDTYSGGKTNILMAYKENNEKLWALIQYGFRNTEKNILVSKIGWAEIDSLKLNDDQLGIINEVLSP
jgi:hypothetical protein